MAGSISSSLSAALARMSAIENNFNALNGVEFNTLNPALDVEKSVSASEIKNNFKDILDKKLEENKENKETDKTSNEEMVEVEISPTKTPLSDSKISKKESINLKSKIDLKSQKVNVDEIIDTFSEKYDIDRDFIKAIINKESGFNVNATSKKGAMGLMQLMPTTAKSLGVADAYNPWENVEGGVKYLKKLLNTYNDDKKMALAAYNAGPTAVKRYGGIPPYKETQNYVNSIMDTYNKIKGVELWLQEE